MPADETTRRHFTDAARAAAMVARQRKREMRDAIGNERPEVFVVRQLGGTLQFQWQIRRFGGIVLTRSDDLFVSAVEARSAGKRVLADHEL